MQPQPTPHAMDRIGFTADAIAARRTLMNLPYATDIYEILKRKLAGTPAEQDLIDALKSENLDWAVFFEARYITLDDLIRATGTKKILELAAGLAPRGLIWSEDPAVEYVELDLPKKSGEKNAIVHELVDTSKIKPRNNLHLEAGDVTSFDDLSAAIKHFGGTGPIVIANEGLLRYQTHEQKRVLAGHIKHFLEIFGGYWISADVNIYRELDVQSSKLRPYMKAAQARMGDLRANLFKDVPEAQQFYENLGFDVQIHPFMDVSSKLVLPAKINMSAEEVENLISWRVAFVMKLK